MTFKEIRESKGITSSHICKVLNICASTLRAKENGDRNFTAPEAKKLCEIYNVSIADVDV